MKLIFAGSGSAFTVGSSNYHSNMLLENDGGQRLLIDCGSDARLSLHELGLGYRDIHDVYISHLHADHAGGLEWLGFTSKFDPACRKPHLYVHENLVRDLWEKVLCGGLSSVQLETAALSTFFEVHPIPENGSFMWDDQLLQTVQTLHVVSGFTIMPSYGLLLTVDGLTIYITTDTRFSPTLVGEYYALADIIFHDCETAKTKSGVHPHYEQLLTLPTDIRKKMWLYHYNAGPLPDAVKDGFRGWVTKGQCFDFKNNKSY